MANGGKSTNKILYIATFPPRECGIATFTQDLTFAMDVKFNPKTKAEVTAVNEDPTSIYNYGKNVFTQIAANNIESYVSLAERVNKRSDIKLVNIQHEFGIFGGTRGDFLIPFLQVIRKPVVTTFHSVIPHPDEHLENVVRFIVSKSKAIVVMNKLSKDVLARDYDAPKSKIYLIPHGIPATAFEPSDKYKTELGLQGKIVLSTFGLMSPNKGIQYAIKALPNIKKRYPNVIYLVLGETHPNVRREFGESYRNSLHRLVDKLKLKDNVKFYDKYLSLDEIVNYLKATDVYISPSLGQEQSVSGTLSYAMGCGRPVVSTKTVYARYLVNGRNGLLVNFKSSSAIARAAKRLLSNELLLKNISTGAYETTRKMIWPNVAAAYFEIFKKIADVKVEEDKLPQIKFDHLVRMTDDVGIHHFAKYSKPERRYGYSLDDNARALLVSATQYVREPSEKLAELMHTYLRFMKFMQRSDGTFANIVSAKRERDETRDDDVQGRAVWALGFTTVQLKLPEAIRLEANRLLKRSIKMIPRIRSPRAIAFVAAGLYHYLLANRDKRLMTLFVKLADRELEFYRLSASSEWNWFEDQLSYSNSKLPESLFYAYDLTRNRKYLEVAEKSLAFLSSITFNRDSYIPIGQNGWYFRNRKRAYFDQQPEDTASMVETKVVAYKITGKRKHLNDALQAFQWFLGKNHLKQMVYDEVTGGCCDGVGQYSLNLNQGAESTISYLLARLRLEEAMERNKTQTG